LNPATGALIRTYPWPTFLPEHRALIAAAGNLFVGGYGLGSVEAVTGDPRTWPLANVDGNVFAQASVGTRVYSGGVFTAAGFELRQNLAAFDAITGALDDWNPGANGLVTAMAAGEGIVYVGGSFTQVAGESHSHLAAIVDPDQFLAAPTGNPIDRGLAIRSVSPNPISTSSVIRFVLERSALVSLELVDLAGRRTRQLLDQRALAAGEHHVDLREGGLRAGIYWLVLSSGGGRTTRKVAILP
jgi:hypothetical protein